MIPPVFSEMKSVTFFLVNIRRNYTCHDVTTCLYIENKHLALKSVKSPYYYTPKHSGMRIYKCADLTQKKRTLESMIFCSFHSDESMFYNYVYKYAKLHVPSLFVNNVFCCVLWEQAL
jgi:hypothetical protein